MSIYSALAEILAVWYTATLLSGEMPDDIEDVFAGQLGRHRLAVSGAVGHRRAS